MDGTQHRFGLVSAALMLGGLGAGTAGAHTPATDRRTADIEQRGAVSG
jgi:hypothetical protein